MEFTFRVTNEGGMDFGDRGTAHFKHYLKSNPGVVCRVTPILPESNKQRRFFEGAIVPLLTYYQVGLNHRNDDDRAKVREWLKVEFNGESIMLGGTLHKIGRSTKGSEALNAFLERVVEWLIDNYAPPPEALDPKGYKVWKETVFPYGGADNYIDYLVERRVL